MNARRVGAAVALVLLAAFMAWFFIPTLSNDRQASDPKVSGVARASRSPHMASVARKPSAPDFVSLAVREIESSSDLRASYEKYKSASDGQILFRLSNIIDDCHHFAEKSADQISREMNGWRGKEMKSLPRRLAIERQIQRCSGFKGWPLTEAVRALQMRAVQLDHPAAIASYLMLLPMRGWVDQGDAEAIRLLSEGTLGGDVIWGVYLYLDARNGDSWRYQFGDPTVNTAAWVLLRCNYGGTCDENSHFVFMACIYYAACEQTDAASALPHVYPDLTPEKFAEAVRIMSILASHIENRDWVRLGFSKQEIR